MAKTATSGGAERRSVGTAAGFTLIELLVVLTIVAASATIGVALYGRGMTTVSARGAAWDIASALRGARARAIRDNADALFLLDVRNRAFRAAEVEGALPQSVTLTMVGAANERVSVDVGGIRFHADGSSSGGRITVASESRIFRIGVDWLTGRVTVGD
jgi:general secretion pathway protein H